MQTNKQSSSENEMKKKSVNESVFLFLLIKIDGLTFGSIKPQIQFIHTDYSLDCC